MRRLPTDKFLFYLFNIFLYLVIFKGEAYKGYNDEAKKVNETDGGILEEHEGFKVLKLSGSHYDMGLQYGKLLKERYLQNRRAWLNFFDKKLRISHESLLHVWSKTESYIPQEYVEEMKGRADALDLPFEEIAIMEIMSTMAAKKRGCCSAAFWGPATVNGELYHLRSQDLPLDTAIDPITSTPVYENGIIVVRKPNKGFASIFPDYPCNIGIEGGFNEKGICLGWMDSASADQTMYGIPVNLRQLIALDHASNLDETIEILDSSKTIGCNFIISDSKTPEGIIMEQNTKYTYIGKWNDPTESQGGSWSIDHVVRRTNFFINPLLSSTQREIGYNKNIFLSIFFPIFCHYVAVSRGIEKNLGSLDLNRTMEMLRAAYLGETYVPFSLQRVLFRRESFNQWVACPKTGDMLFSFAQNGKSAHESPVFHVNLFKLSKSK